MHFSGSHRQVTMHTRVLYVGQNNVKPFCTLSDSTLHDPAENWTYLYPVSDQQISTSENYQLIP